MNRPRAIWLMVPAAVVDARARSAACRMLDAGRHRHRRRQLLLPRRHPPRQAVCTARSHHYVDVGTSGGVAGLERGYCLMIGGETEVVERLTPIFAALAPGVGAAPRTRGRAASSASAEQGYLHCGPQRRRPFRQDGPQRHRIRPDGRLRRRPEHPEERQRRQARARESTPKRRRCAHPEYYQYDMNLAEIAEVWRRGSVIGSWLLDLTAGALAARSAARGYGGRVSDSGEGRWTIEAAIDEARAGARARAPRCSSASARAAKPTSPTRCCRRCATSSAATWKSGGGRRERAHVRIARRPRRTARRPTRWSSSASPATSRNKKIFPALYAMVKSGRLDVPVIGVASIAAGHRRRCSSARATASSTTAARRPAAFDKLLVAAALRQRRLHGRRRPSTR